MRFLFVLLACSLVLSGCGLRVELEPAAKPVKTEVDPPRIALFSFDPKAVVLSFEHDEADPKSVSDWAEKIEGEVLVANGVYFHEDFFPSGILISNGWPASSREFDVEKSGLLILQPSFDIVDTAKTPVPDLTSLKEAAQSYPFLIKDGQPAVKEDSGLVARRTFIGNDENGRIYLGIVNADAVSLYELAQELDAMEIVWKNVLNLDGGPSSGIITSDTSDVDFDSFSAIPNVVVVSPRS